MVMMSGWIAADALDRDGTSVPVRKITDPIGSPRQIEAVAA
jgi:hypothetical protein